MRAHMCDGNYVVASNHKRPWQKQLSMLAAYLYFYNPVWLIVALIRDKTPVSKRPAYMQIIGMMGLVMTMARTSGWAMRLMFGRIELHSHPPVSEIPMRSTAAGAPASHDKTVAPIQSSVFRSGIPRHRVRWRSDDGRANLLSP